MTGGVGPSAMTGGVGVLAMAAGADRPANEQEQP